MADDYKQQRQQPTFENQALSEFPANFVDFSHIHTDHTGINTETINDDWFTSLLQNPLDPSLSFDDLNFAMQETLGDSTNGDQEAPALDTPLDLTVFQRPQHANTWPAFTPYVYPEPNLVSTYSTSSTGHGPANRTYNDMSRESFSPADSTSLDWDQQSSNFYQSLTSASSSKPMSRQDSSLYLPQDERRHSASMVNLQGLGGWAILQGHELPLSFNDYSAQYDGFSPDTHIPHDLPLSQGANSQVGWTNEAGSQSTPKPARRRTESKPQRITRVSKKGSTRLKKARTWCQVPGCVVSMSRAIDMQRHMKVKHGSKENMYRCLLCAKDPKISKAKENWVFPLVYNLKEHLRRLHRNVPESNPDMMVMRKWKEKFPKLSTYAALEGIITPASEEQAATRPTDAEASVVYPSSQAGDDDSDPAASPLIDMEGEWGERFEAMLAEGGQEYQ